MYTNAITKVAFMREGYTVMGYLIISVPSHLKTAVLLEQLYYLKDY